MTYQGSLGDVSTLAHEIGHAFHHHVLRDTRVLARQYPMTLAETASTFAESVLSAGLLAEPGITDATRAEMRRVLKDIQTGAFTSDWIREFRAGLPKFKATRRMNDSHRIEEVGSRLRGMMPWIKKNALVDKERN
mgnify:CR=1 FL=1